MTQAAPRSINLPSSVTDWLRPGERSWIFLPSVLRLHDEAAIRAQILEWDALTGRLIREALFGDGESRALRQCAEAVAAVVEVLTVRLGEVR